MYNRKVGQTAFAQATEWLIFHISLFSFSPDVLSLPLSPPLSFVV